MYMCINICTCNYSILCWGPTLILIFCKGSTRHTKGVVALCQPPITLHNYLHSSPLSKQHSMCICLRIMHSITLYGVWLPYMMYGCRICMQASTRSEQTETSACVGGHERVQSSYYLVHNVVAAVQNNGYWYTNMIFRVDTVCCQIYENSHMHGWVFV